MTRFDDYFCIFLRQNIHSNFGEIGQTIKALMDRFQTQFENQKKVESITDMKNFVETYPQFKVWRGKCVQMQE